MIYVYLVLLFSTDAEIRLPVNCADASAISLTDIGKFGLRRKDRPDVPAHYHTGIDIRRPTNNYESEPIFSVAAGVVISIRSKGAYSQVIVHHQFGGEKFWTNYEHVAGIRVRLGQQVEGGQRIARFMNRGELNLYGWQFDHFHFEVLRIAPSRLSSPEEPHRRFASHTLTCVTPEQLEERFHEPLSFLQKRIR